jgi:hypothetical protein
MCGAGRFHLSPTETRVPKIEVIHSGEMSDERSAKWDALEERRKQRLQRALETTENLSVDILIPKDEQGYSAEQLAEANRAVRSAGESDLKRILARAAADEAKAWENR